MEQTLLFHSQGDNMGKNSNLTKPEINSFIKNGLSWSKNLIKLSLLLNKSGLYDLFIINMIALCHS